MFNWIPTPVQCIATAISGRKHRYGFNGKEENYDLGEDVSTLDFGARLYDPTIGRWTRSRGIAFRAAYK